MNLSSAIIDKRVTILKNFFFFKRINYSDLTKIAMSMQSATFQPGEKILTQGDIVNGLHIVESGYVNILVNREIVRIKMPPGESIGEMSCLASHSIPATASVVAVNHVTTLFIPREKVKQLANQIPIIWENAWEEISSRLYYINLRFSEMLNHTQLMTVNKDGVISGEMSKICSTILGIDMSDLQNRKFSDVMFQSTEQKNDWDETFPLLFGGQSIPAIINLLPSRTPFITPDNKKIYLEFKYLPCENQAGVFDKVHVNIDDITVQMNLERRSSELEKEKIIRDKLYEEPEGFLELLSMLDKCIDALKRLEMDSTINVDIKWLKRLIHTVKGGAGLFYLDYIQRAAHEIEDFFMNLDEMINTSHFKERVKLFEQCRMNAHNFFEKISPEIRKRFTGTVVPETTLQALKQAVDAEDLSQIKQLVYDLESVHLEKIVFGWQEMIDRLGNQMNKYIDFETFNLDTIKLHKDKVKALSSCLVHIVRNSVYHGIETMEEREEAAKESPAQICVKADQDDHNVIITISDNGRGINLDRIKQKVLEKIHSGEINHDSVQSYLDQGNIAELIFLPGLSTAENINEVSGRGVGMDAVKETVVKLDGTIDIKTEMGHGTAFIITIPK